VVVVTIQIQEVQPLSILAVVAVVLGVEEQLVVQADQVL
jgi:hypothetical protein